jgi:hypothetical protein
MAIDTAMKQDEFGFTKTRSAGMIIETCRANADEFELMPDNFIVAIVF